MEEDLFNMLRHMNFGQMEPTSLMINLLRAYELNVLRQMDNIIKARIKELAKGAAKVDSSSDLDPFSILGVSMDASEEEVKNAYRGAAWKAHPDHGGTDEQMARVNAAYEVIRRFKGWK